MARENLKNARQAAGDVIGILINDCKHLRTIKPNIVLKYY